MTALSMDGVSCSVCHQIDSANFGEEASFSGGFEVAPQGTPRKAFGPYEIDRGRTRVMESANGYVPTASGHIQSSELCATCHTLHTHSLGPDGSTTGRLPEQTPYLEWQHSAYASSQSCQSCHMPGEDEPVAVSSVLPTPREEVSRHTFRGGNFFIPRMLLAKRGELGVEALPLELEQTARSAREHLEQEAASLSVQNLSVDGDTVAFAIEVVNHAGHKLPSAYPSRRAWLHVTVRDGARQAVFESGAPKNDGSITGNDNDVDPRAYEPHHTMIRSPGQVQIYESILGDPEGRVTTGLLAAVRYLKDNRVLPSGFDKTTAGDDIAVYGAARDDEDFGAEMDRVQYVIDTGGAKGPFVVEAELLYQPIGFRWARNLAEFESVETSRFVAWYREMSNVSWVTLAKARAMTE
jgi:hypothetical protein